MAPNNPQGDSLAAPATLPISISTGMMMNSQRSRPAWERIKACEGQEFRTKTDLPFTYQVDARPYPRIEPAIRSISASFGKPSI
jgi:hypothetical protein